MANAFDPDAYLEGGTTAIAAPEDFDPDQYLKEKPIEEPYTGRFAAMIDEPPDEPTEIEKRGVAANKQAATPLVPAEYTPPFLLAEAAGKVLPDSTATHIYTGELKAVGDVLSSFTSPINIALLGVGGLGRVAQRLIAGAFSAQAAIHSPEAIKEFNETDDLERKTRIAVGTIAGVGLPLLAMKGGRAPEAVAKAVEETLVEQAKEVDTPKDFSPDQYLGTAETFSPDEYLGMKTPQQPAEPAVPTTQTIQMVDRQGKAREVNYVQEPNGSWSTADDVRDLPLYENMGAEAMQRALETARSTTEAETAVERAQVAEPADVSKIDILQPGRPTKTDQLETQARAEMEADMRSVGSEQGRELFDAVQRAGGLPSKASKARSPFAGELAQLEENMTPAQRRSLFNRDAPDVDELATRLRDHGFDVQTENDVINLMDERARTGRPIYGTPAAAEVFGFGPGAASASEPLASYEKRSFGERFVEDLKIAEQIRENTGNRYYEPIPNKITADEAATLLNSRPISDVINAVRDDQSALPFHIRSTMGQIAIKRLNRAYETLTKGGDEKGAEVVLNQAVDLAEWQQEFGTRLGQGVQSFAMWQRLSPEGKLTGIQRTVRKARDNYTAEHLEEIEEIKRTLLAEKISDGERLAALRKLFKTNPTAKQIKPHLQKLIAAARTGKFTDQIFYDIVSDQLGLPKYDQQTATEIMRIAFRIDKAAEGLPKDRATLELSKFIAERIGFKASDVPIGIYYGNMLSGYNTQIVNTLDTFLNVASELNGLALTNPRAAARIYGNALKGFVEGRADFLLALTKGRMMTDAKWLEVPRLMEVAKFGQKGGVPINVKSRTGAIVKAIAEARPAKILNVWKYVGRLMAASDAVMFRGAKEGRAALLADRLAREEGLRGQALDRRVQELLGRTAEQESAFRATAQSEGFTGASGVARISELRDQLRIRILEARGGGNDFAGVATYNHEPQGVLGYLATGIGKAANRYPLLKIVVPFTRIVANVTNRGLNYTPWGFKRSLYGYSGDIGKITGDQRAAMLARATMGTAGLTALLVMQAGGALEIHGAGPSDPERRRQLEQAGWKPYSLKIGDKYFSYIYTPVGLGLSILGNMSDSSRYKELDHKDAVTRAVYAISRIGSTVFSQSFLSGLSNVFRALSGPSESVSAIKSLISSTAGTATTPRIVLDLQRLFDPTRYQSSTIAGDLLRNTPFAATTNKPALNAFGEPATLPTNRFVSEVRNDVAWQLVMMNNLRVPVPDKYTQMPDGRGGKRQISPDEYYEYLEKTGPKLKQFIMLHALELSEMDPERAQQQLSDKAEEIRQSVIERLRRRARLHPL